MKFKQALISVHDKTGLEELGTELQNMNISILSTGGTFKFLNDKAIKCRQLSEYTDMPEILEGRVKTLHPKVFGGILFKRDVASHVQDISKNNIESIDIVVVNLYPFASVIKREHTFEEAVENIDIGGVSLIRAAAKNHKFTLIIVDPTDYTKLINQLKSGDVTEQFKKELSIKAFRQTSEYDNIIGSYLGKDDKPMEYVTLSLKKKQDLRYGENPHQSATLCKISGSDNGITNANILSGKELSYNNIVDLDSAHRAVADFKDPTCVIVKHNNPCGVSSNPDLSRATANAIAADSESAYGGIIALNTMVDEKTAKIIASKDNFFEAIIAPGYEPETTKILTTSTPWGKNLRILELSSNFNSL